MDKKKTIFVRLALGFIVVIFGVLFIAINKTIKPIVSESAADGLLVQSKASTEVANYNEIKIGISQLNKKIDKIGSSLLKLSQNLESSSAIKEQHYEKSRLVMVAPSSSTSDNEPMAMERPTDWLINLDQNTRTRVESAFKNNALRIREATWNLGDIENVDGKVMQEIFEQNQESLKDELKGVLSSEDYEKFLASLPPIPKYQPLDELPKLSH